MANLARHYPAARIEAAAARLLEAQLFSYAALKRVLERQAAAPQADSAALTQGGPHVRPLTEYQSFWEAHSQTHSPEDTDGNVDH